MTIKRRFWARLLCACFAGMLLFGSFRYYAYADTAEIEESIKQKQKEIQDAQKKKKELLKFSQNITMQEVKKIVLIFFLLLYILKV